MNNLSQNFTIILQSIATLGEGHPNPRQWSLAGIQILSGGNDGIEESSELDQRN